MRKTFKLSHERHKPERWVEAIKHEIKKYIKRERRRDLPEGADYLDFDCRFGKDMENSEEIHLSAINEHIDWAVDEQLDAFYIEVIGRPSIRKKRD